VFVGFEDGHRIELVKYHEPASPGGYLDVPQLGASHICFNVDDLQKAYEKLSARGIQFVTEPKFSERDGRRSGIVYAQDPEGNWLEFIE
jgi:catechol 2,3-dioxygenase-like lactoylglutathione lyase family enzyme